MTDKAVDTKPHKFRVTLTFDIESKDNIEAVAKKVVTTAFRVYKCDTVRRKVEDLTLRGKTGTSRRS